MPEKVLYHFERDISDKYFNRSNFRALQAWLNSFGKEDFGQCKRFFPTHLYKLDGKDTVDVSFYSPSEEPGRLTFCKSHLTCRIYCVYNRYGRSMRAELPVGGKKNWAEFFEQLDRVLLHS